MFLRWQATILNKIYQTTLFNKIIITSPSIQSINYFLPFQIYQSLLQPTLNINIKQLINSIHILCKSNSQQQKRQKIIYLNKIIQYLNIENKNIFNFYHVIIFSSLSKCTIWPGMYKTSQKLIPLLISFYTSFHNYFKEFLQYKFDPLILSSKFNKIVKQIKQKRLSNPQLFNSIKNNNIQSIKNIIQTHPNLLNQCIQQGLYISHYSAIHSNLPTLRFLLQNHINFQLLDQQKQTSIFYAIKRFDLQIIKFFIEQAKININHTQFQNRTPIYLAAFQGKLEIVKYLYNQGANPEIQSKLLRTPLSKACYLGNVQVVKYLIQIGVRIESVDSKGRTALHNAAWGKEGGRQGKRRGNVKLEDSPECVELLIKAGHSVDFQDYDMFTPVFSAISSHAERSLRLLVHYGANLAHKTVKDQTSVFIACKYGHLKIIKILIEDYKCDFLQQNNQGYSPLAATFTRDQYECTYYLLYLYLQLKIKSIKLISIFKCLLTYKKVENITYLLQWINIQQLGIHKDDKIQYISKEIDANIEELMDCVFTSNSNDLQNGLIKIIITVQSHHMSHKSMDKILYAIEKYQIYTNDSLKIIINYSKNGNNICKIIINDTIHQTIVLQLLSIQSNLIQNLQNLYSTLIILIQMKYTKAILYILTQYKSLTNDKIDIIQLLFNKVQGKISINDFCLIHGHYDIHKIINTFFHQHYSQTIKQFYTQNRPIIPSYTYQQLQSNQIKSYLYPIQNLQLKLTFQSITKEYLSQQQLRLYHKIINKQQSISNITPIIIKDQQKLQQMNEKLNKTKIIGIDIQHYSSNNQSFICLIQIATFDSIYIIDRFNHIHQQLSSFLTKLFKNNNIIKIFHSYDNDLKWLVQDYQIEQFYNIFDTSRIYSLLEYQKNNTPSLKSLAYQFLGMEIKKEFQKSDWRIRPLFDQMIQYAGNDAYLLPFIMLNMIEKGPNLKSINPESMKIYQTKRPIKSSKFKNILKYLP